MRQADTNDRKLNGDIEMRQGNGSHVGTALWPVWDSTLHLMVTDRSRLAAARKLVIEQVTAIDEACNPLRPDSEVRALRRARGRPVRLSPLLAELVAVSLRAALLSDGCLDHISLDRISSEVLRAPGEPAGTMLDLSTMARAYAVDRCARLVHERCGAGVRVAIGGDIAVAGQPPARGWASLIRSAPAARDPLLTLDCTMSTTAGPQSSDRDASTRSTVRPGSRSAVPLWRSVSVAAAPCTYAKALSMAAMMRGRAAPDWLRGLGVSARLVATNGEVITVGRWPAHGLG
ncbi:FAD:protein FMN transferase [Dactylosporangium sp. NPDC049525]|uniref:FAD:protein FMN transferase n=1 Tax=Dactylosporangium sp. NPDC049525 TaxID=3154730 RepID=UPI0034391ABA